MKHAVLSGARQAFGPRFLAGVLVMAAAVLAAGFDAIHRAFQSEYLMPAGFHTQMIASALASDTAIPFLPMAAVLPFAGTFVEDIKSKFARFFCIRSGWMGYLSSRLIVCFLSGALAVVGGALLAWGAAALVLLPRQEAGAAQEGLLTQILWLYALCGGFWAVVGMSLSTLMESKYIAYASPFVLYYLLVILHERYTPSLYVLDPAQWIVPQARWPFGAMGPAAVVLELTAVFAGLFIIRAERRLKAL